MSSLMLIASGMAGGLGACLVLRFVWAAVAGRAPSSTKSDTGLWRHSGAANEILYVGSHALIGAGIGLLFWLSWGFTALSNLTWWQQGLSFALLNALVFGVLPLAVLRSLLRCAISIYWVLLCELLCTSVAASLAVSWSWKHAF